MSIYTYTELPSGNFALKGDPKEKVFAHNNIMLGSYLPNYGKIAIEIKPVDVTYA